MPPPSSSSSAPTLQLEGLLGFNGGVARGLQYTGAGGASTHVVYPLGAMCVVRNLATEGQLFLHGHRHTVSALAVSPDGTLLASGEVSVAPGTKADIIVWDLARARELADANAASAGGSKQPGLIRCRLRQHLGRVQDVGFNRDGSLLASLGGQDDNTVLVWRLADHVHNAADSHGGHIVDTDDPSPRRALCGARASDDQTLCLQWLHTRPDRFVTGGYFSLRVWEVDPSLPRIHPMEVRVGSLRRTYQCLAISADDKLCYAGTRTGDLVRVRIDRDPIPRSNCEPDTVRPTLEAVSPDKFEHGARAVVALRNPTTGQTNLLVGAGDGRVALVHGVSLRPVAGKSAALLGGITSLAVAGGGFLVGTDQSNRYWIPLDDFAGAQLLATCHYAPISRVAFPAGTSELFVTCSRDDVRVWNATKRQELLRIRVPNLEARSVAITGSGTTLVTGWSDGKVRAFYPESGKLRFVIPQAHTEAVTALAVCHDEEGTGGGSPSYWRLVSGGADGRVRVWRVGESHQALAFSAKEHRGAVNALTVTRDNRQCISASADGSCIVWDLDAETRLFAILEPTAYEAALYHPDGSQILTAGTHHMVGYWDAYDGSAIRVLEGGEDAMTALDVDGDGTRFVSGSADRAVKVWDYETGVVLATGRGHSGAVRDVKFAPDARRVVSVGAEGGIFLWRVVDEGRGEGLGMEKEEAEEARAALGGVGPSKAPTGAGGLGRSTVSSRGKRVYGAKMTTMPSMG